MKVSKDNENSSFTAKLRMSTGKLIKISTTEVKKLSLPKGKPKESPKKPNPKKTNPVKLNQQLNQKHQNILY